MTNTEEAKVIIHKIFKDGFRDGHKTVQEKQVPEVVLLRIMDNDVNVCFGTRNSRYFCVNPFFMTDSGEIYLSTGSIGGVVDLRTCNLENAVRKYNLDNDPEELTIVTAENPEAGINAIEMYEAWRDGDQYENPAEGYRW